MFVDFKTRTFDFGVKKFLSEVWWCLSSLSKFKVPVAAPIKVLKLYCIEFGDNREWKVRNGKFPQLKFLELDELSLMKWIVADDAFPNPDQLVLHGCQDLVEIPSCFMDILSLKYIEVDNCNKYVVKSAKNIQETQVEDNQNTNFKLVIVKNTVLKFDISHDKELNKAIKRLTSILGTDSYFSFLFLVHEIN